MNQQKTIFITISRGSLIRNFFHTGVIERLLKSGLRVVVLSPFYDKEKYFEGFQHPNLIREPLIIPKSSWRNWRNILTTQFLQIAVFNPTLRARYKYQIAVEVPPSKLLYPIRVYILALLRFIPGFKKFVQFLDLLIRPSHEHDYLFKKYKPEITFVTSPKDHHDASVMKSARRYRSKLVAMPKSWDNLSNTLFSVHADTLIVWNNFMKKQAIGLHGYAEREIVVTGAPQFDFYTHTDELLTREDFCKAFGFDPNKKIILYGSSGADMCDEHLYVGLLKEFIDSNELKDVQVLVRPHTGYRGDADRFVSTIGNHPSIVLDKTDVQDLSLRDYWDPSVNHLRHLYNSLHHASVMVNVGSTLTIDSTIVDTPVINLKFDVNKDVDYKTRSTLRLFHSDYLTALLATDASYVVESKKELLEVLKNVLVNGVRKEGGMKYLVEEFAHKRDGRAAERIANCLLSAIQTK